MTDREAIDIYKNSHKHDYLELMEADEVAYDALQERIDRKRGCEWCKDLANPHWRGQHLALIEGDSFCRKCGRKLKTAMSEEEV